MDLPYKKDAVSDFSKYETREAFVRDAHNAGDLLRKELEINDTEQVLLNERIRTMKVLLNELPSSDAQYNALTAQIEMDRIELDELKSRREAICEQLRTLEEKRKIS
jgi:hypothetical protein